MNKRFDRNQSVTKNAKEPPGVYQHATIGRTLQESVNQLESQNKLTPFLAWYIMKVFNRKVATNDKIIGEVEPLEFQAKSVEHHKLKDNLWGISLRNVIIHPNGEGPLKINKLQIWAETWGDGGEEKQNLLENITKRQFPK